MVIADPGGPRTSSWRTHRLCLEVVPDDASHLLVVQDDAQPCDGFAALARQAILERPDTILALFTPGFANHASAFNIARKQHRRWADLHIGAYVPVVAIVYPADLARAIPAFSDRKRIGPSRADDAVIASFVKAHRLPVVATVPCLVQHRDELPSVQKVPHGQGRPHRLAAWFQQDAAGFAVETSAVAV